MRRLRPLLIFIKAAAVAALQFNIHLEVIESVHLMI
jgi:hypothetical protein